MMGGWKGSSGYYTSGADRVRVQRPCARPPEGPLDSAKVQGASFPSGKWRLWPSSLSAQATELADLGRKRKFPDRCVRLTKR